ncbi:MAG: hypothetical protein QNK77_11385 [Crocinitomicaceae bacterium]
MKKSIFAVALILGATSTTLAQDKQYTPVAGDWAISIDANPFLNYLGNFIGGTDANDAPTWNHLSNNQRIIGKYFVADDMAYRAGIRLDLGGDSEKNMVADRASTADPAWPSTDVMVENSAKYRETNIALTGGLEWRKGKGRLQGFYGGELGVSIGSMKDSYTYGNALTSSAATNAVNVDAADDFTGGQLPSSLANGTDGIGNPYLGRILEDKSGMSFGLGIRGFIGAEYFVLPKLSIGGEFGWGLVFMSNGASSTTHEAVGTTFGGTSDGVQEVTDEGDKSSEFGFDTDNNNAVFGSAATLKMTFHF